MRNALRVIRFVLAALGAILLAAARPAAADGFDLNHYILGCGDTCPTIATPVVLGSGRIDATFTGSWYDPAQNGQGLSIEVLPGNRMLAFWFTFNPDGTRQTWLIGAGTYGGNYAWLPTVEMPTGGLWIPNFDPAQVVSNPWGTLALRFQDAEHGRADFTSTAGYGSGSMNLVRLTRPAAITTTNWAAERRVGIGDDCSVAGSCFSPSPLTINVGESVAFFEYADTMFTGFHNVVADDGSFRCAVGCDGEGGDGTPVSDSSCDATGFCVSTGGLMSFSRTFNVPGIVKYHDEVSKATGIIVVQAATQFAIGPGITGVWYDPAQSGHGLVVEVLPDNRMLVEWYAFDPAGAQQSWLLGVGSVNGNTATITAVDQPTGGRFIPNFDASKIVHNPWGSLTFTFTDCDHGKVDFASTAGYGSGSMNLTRLTRPAGVVCP
jgi:plastocyanin